jgi:hypothetical protein
MAQAKGQPSTRAVDSLSSSNEKTLGANQSIKQMEDGAVVLTTTLSNGACTSRRVDSDGDLDHVAKGGDVWWKALLREQDARDKAAAPKKSAKKVTSDE